MNTDLNAICNLLEEPDSAINTLIDQMPGGFLIYRADNEEILYANQALLRIFNCDTMEDFQQCTGNSFRGLVHPQDWDNVQKSIRTQIADSRFDLDYVEYRIVQKGGEIRWIEDFGHFIHDKKLGDVFYVFLVDATEKKKRQDREQDFFQSQLLQRLEMIEGLSTDYDSIFYVDLDTDFIQPYRVSHRVKALLGDVFPITFTGFDAQYINTWVYPEDRETLFLATCPDCIRERLAKNRSFLVNYRILREEKTEYLQLRVVNVGYQERVSKIVLGYRSVDEEITRRMEQRQLLEDALKQARAAIVARNIFLSNMSHDIRTPMNAIAGFTSLARNHLHNTEKLSGCLDGIETANRQLLRLVNDVLEISRLESGRLHLEEEPCSLNKLLEDVHAALLPSADAKNLSLTLEYSALRQCNVYADSEKLLQILFQLGSNAVKYTENEGQIRIAVRDIEYLPPDYAVYQFTVEDTGIGISEEFISHLFEPFERQKNTTLSGVYGTGLGLPIVKGLVEMMNGQIKVDSASGRGSCFTVTLRLRLADTPSIETTETTPDAPCAPIQRILLVEDNEINREIESELLEEAGFLIDTAENGRIALEMLQNSEPGFYGLILMDIQMPVMDGYEATQAIRMLKTPELSSIPIIALSANAFEEDRRMSLEKGMNDHLAKPMDIDQVLAQIRELTDVPASSPV